MDSQSQKERDFKEAIKRRRATLRESLKLKAVQQNGTDVEHGPNEITTVGTTPATETTSFSTDTKTLFETLKERRLKRRGQLPPLNRDGAGSSPPPTQPDTAESTEGSDHTPTTLRERLRQRIQEGRENKQIPMASELDPPPRRKLRGLRDQPRVTRFDEPLTDDPQTRQPLMGDSMEQTNQLKKKVLYETKTVKEVRQKQAHVVDQEAYDFFTSEIENYSFPVITRTHIEQPHLPVGGVEGSGETPAAAETELEGSDTLALREELLQQIQNQEEEQEELVEEETPFIEDSSPDGSQELLLPGYARYIPQRERLSREDKAYFIPSTIPVSAEQKTPDSGPPHYLEDEGLYVGERPHVLWTNQVAMENRLLRRTDKGVGWFGEDGRLLVQPSPLSKIHTRPQILHYTGEENIRFKHVRYESYNQKLISKVTGSDETEYQLEVDISTLRFSHHPLFSSEHVLASKLQLACKQFTRKKNNKATEYYYEKLQGLRQAVFDLKQALQNLTEDSSDPGSHEVQSQLLDYCKELRTVRQKRKDAIAAEYELLKSILKTWQQLKAVRDNQGYSSTTAWLTVRRLTTNAVDEEGQMRREIEDEVCEVRDIFELENGERMATYEREVSEWKTYEKSRRRALRQAVRTQQQQQQQQQQANDQGTEMSAADGSQTSLADPMAAVPPERPRPSQPPVFDEAEVRGELVEYYRSHHKSPGEALLVPEFRHNHAISQQVPRPEQQRRDEIGRMKFHVRVLFNNQLVSQTKEIALNSDFAGELNESFTLRIVQWPESIKLQFYESGLISSNLISEVYVPIPETHQTMEGGAEQEPYHFSSNKMVEYGHTAVGSGHTHPALPEEGILVTSGVVNVGVYWGVDDSGKTLCPPGLTQQMAYNSNRVDAISSLGMTGIADLQEVKKWIERSRLDPNDPRNAELLHLVESIPSTAEKDCYFRLVAVDEAERFVNDKEFDRNRRFAVLKMREEGHPGLKNKSVPIDARLISESMWRSTANYKPYADYDLPLLFFGDFHGVRKEEQNRFLLDVRERVLSRVRTGKGNLILEDVVHCDIAPSIGAILNTVKEITAPRRPLNPARKTRRKPKPLNVHVTSAKILIRVVRAFNIPTRTTGQSAGVLTHPLSTFSGHRPSLSLPPGQSESAPGPHDPSTLGVLTPQLSIAGPAEEDSPLTRLAAEELNVVCPYVEIGFRGSVARTSTACGPSPFWNEELSLQFLPPHNDFSPSNLQKVTDVLHISLFDEVVTDILQDDRQRSTNIHHRIEKKWLGSFTLPFSTLHQRERIEGTFQLEVPVVLLGYSHAPQNTPNILPQTINHLQGLATSTHTYLQLFVTVEPPLSVLPPIKNEFGTKEDSEKMTSAGEWLKKLKKSFPKRNFVATAVDILGRRVFVTRFVKAQTPPDELAPPHGTNITVAILERLARYVSLIPFLADALTFSGACDIWTTSDQFLHMLAGDEEEHALLLCNYFLNCGMKAWVVLGQGVPEGDTAYVLTETPENGVGYWLWNASSGHHYTQHESYIPLKSVGSVINQFNVWANIQDYDDPGRIVFDLSNSKHWLPLFPSDSQPLSSVQQDLHYTETDVGKVKELQERIERTVHDHITTLRDRFITRWNRHCTQLLHTLLPKLEDNLTSPPLHEHHAELAEITASYKLTGFPIHSPYTDIPNLLATVERTGVHLCEDQQVEYALAVYVHSYPNDVISVWLYIASLVPK